MKKNGFEAVYPFATECVSGYVDLNELEGKKTLTLGSSLDQAFNFFVGGASKVVVYDINPYVSDFYKLKRDVILNCHNKEEVYYKMLKAVDNNDDFLFSADLHPLDNVTAMNNYLKSDEKFKKLQEILSSNPDIDFINGDIFKISKYIKDKDFDFVNLSNALDYLYLNVDNDLLSMVEEEHKSYVYKKMQLKVLLDLIPQLMSIIGEEGIVLLFYFYNFFDYDFVERDEKRVYENVLGENRTGFLKLYDIFKAINQAYPELSISYDKFSSFTHNKTVDGALYLSKK